MLSTWNCVWTLHLLAGNSTTWTTYFFLYKGIDPLTWVRGFSGNLTISLLIEIPSLKFGVSLVPDGRFQWMKSLELP